MNPQDAFDLVAHYEKPRRRALSSRFPWLRAPIIFVRRRLTWLRNRRYRIARIRQSEPLAFIAARHQSVLRRRLGDSDPALQESKITNLRRACRDLDGLIISPGQVFSLWESIGQPTRARGYVDGMLLSGGRVIPGIGGGLCQLSNFLCWIFLHAETRIIERLHHSMDVFPDSGRVLPFGSGATCLYNFVDLKIQNTSPEPLQLKIWVTDTHLKGQLRAPTPRAASFSVREREHCFIRRGDRYFRYNELIRIKTQPGRAPVSELLFTNFAPVLYAIPADYFSRYQYPVIDLAGARSEPS